MKSRRRKSAVRDMAFLLLWLFIATVSVHDGYRALLNRHVLEHMEQNPLGRLMLQLDSGDVTLLLAAKTAGTVGACALLLKLYWSNPRLGLRLCGVLALVQLLVLVYLEGDLARLDPAAISGQNARFAE
jgi:hypothetical protein